jgi:hypothetical protein
LSLQTEEVGAAMNVVHGFSELTQQLSSFNIVVFESTQQTLLMSDELERFRSQK